MTDLVKRIHLYLGLITFTSLTVYGITGLVETFGPKRLGVPSSERFEAFTAAPGLGDRDVAAAVSRRFEGRQAQPLPEWAVKRDRNNDLTFNRYTSNGPIRYTLLEKESRVHIEVIRESLGQYLDNMHTAHAAQTTATWRGTAWKLYNELSLWALSLMVVSGVYLGLASRPRLRWGKYALATGTVAFIALYVLNR